MVRHFGISIVQSWCVYSEIFLPSCVILINAHSQDEELWMQTQSGLLCAGPIGPCVEHPDALKVMEECHYSIVQTWNPQLPSEYYGDEGAVVHYIERHLKDFHKFVGQYRTNPTNTTWDSIRSSPFDTYSLGSVFDASTGDQVALMELSPNWSYDVRSWNAHVIKVWDCEYSSVISEEGWTRSGSFLIQAVPTIDVFVLGFPFHPIFHSGPSKSRIPWP